MENTENKFKNKENLKALISGIYDLQKLRISTGNRITINIKTKLGQEPSMKENKMEKEAKEYLDTIRKHFKLITDGLLVIPTEKKFKADGVFDNLTEINLAGLYTRLYEDEQLQIKRLEGVLKEFPIWNEFLIDVRGCGPMMAAVIISSLDPYKAKYPSSFHKYIGIDVVKVVEVIDGKEVEHGVGRSRKKESLEEQEYLDKDGNVKTKMGLTFNPWVKTKLVGVLASSFIKQPADKCKYRKIYDDYKNRLENHKIHKEKTKLHRHNMANRYMIKHFLIDLHMKWRELEGLEVSKPYEEAKLGYKHGYQ